MFVPLSVLEFRDRAATYFGDKVGIIDGEQEFTYRTYAERTHRLANALVGLGIGAGDEVLVTRTAATGGAAGGVDVNPGVRG